MQIIKDVEQVGSAITKIVFDAHVDLMIAYSINLLGLTHIFHALLYDRQVLLLLFGYIETVRLLLVVTLASPISTSLIGRHGLKHGKFVKSTAASLSIIQLLHDTLEGRLSLALPLPVILL